MEIREIDWCVTYYANNASNLVAMGFKVVKTASLMFHSNATKNINAI